MARDECAAPQSELRADAERLVLFRDLAGRFPGALRELELGDAGVFRAKLERLDILAEDELWPIVVYEYHRTVKEALAIKRWLGSWPRSHPMGSAEVAAFQRWHERLSPRGALFQVADAPLLEQVRFPPAGRLMNLVWGALEGRFSLPRDILEALVFAPLEDILGSATRFDPAF